MSDMPTIKKDEGLRGPRQAKLGLAGRLALLCGSALCAMGNGSAAVNAPPDAPIIAQPSAGISASANPGPLTLTSPSQQIPPKKEVPKDPPKHSSHASHASHSSHSSHASHHSMSM